MDRRTLLKAAGATAAAAAASPVLAACSGSSGTKDIGNAGKKLAPWPSYVPFNGPSPDAPGDSSGVQPLYLSAPRNPVRSVDQTPGDGSDVTAMIITYGTPPKPVEQNQLWQAVNKALGVNLKLTAVPSGEYQKKMATVMAGGDLPDILFFGGGIPFAREQEFVASQCAELSDLLGGDAVKEYPNLANIPTYTWQGMGRIGGRLYGVPIERPAPGTSLHVNRTALDSVHAPKQWDAAAFQEAMTALSGNRRWGIGESQSGFAGVGAAIYHAGSHGAPNVWRVRDDGVFESTYGTDQFKRALESMRKLAAAGLYYPDSLSVSTADLQNFFFNGTVASYSAGFLAASQPANLAAINGRFEPDLGLPYTPDATPWRDPGYFGYVAFKKAPQARLQLLLRICNYLAAPFGSQEYNLVNYGVEGVHYTRNGQGDVVLTKLAEVENIKNLPIRYIGAAPIVLYVPGYPQVAQRIYDWEKATMAKAVAGPSVGLRSTTWTENRAKLGKIIGDGVAAVVFGRKPLSAWDQVVADFMAGGGSEAAKEFAKEYAANQ